MIKINDENKDRLQLDNIVIEAGKSYYVDVPDNCHDFKIGPGVIHIDSIVGDIAYITPVDVKFNHTEKRFYQGSLYASWVSHCVDKPYDIELSFDEMMSWE